MKIFILLIIALFLAGCSGAGVENKYDTKGSIYRYKGGGKKNKIILRIKIPSDPNAILLNNKKGEDNNE